MAQRRKRRAPTGSGRRGELTDDTDDGGRDGGVDEDGDDLAIPTVAFPSDDDDRSGSGARLNSRRRRRCKG
uniref:Uncharacterized protein K0155E09.12 n=1 Tax=Oryza sativa subsp. indica TaxID=39946 RepID=C8TFI6_ORYSI|nr:hypothetical protein [Oryza sativa Indica Group]